MPSSNATSPYSAEIITDPDLHTDVVALSYTDPRDPARNILACIAPALGSNWYRWRVGAHELLYSQPADIRQRGHTGNFVLWPFPNRVRDSQYTYRGQKYSFASIKRVQSMLIHGLVCDLPWTHTPPTVDQQGASVTTAIEMNPAHPYYEAYPFASRLALTYTLNSTGMTVTYTVENQGTQTLPYGFGLHPYFCLPTGPERTLVTLPATHVMEADHNLLPTGCLLDVHATMYAMFDLNQPRSISQLRLDHVYTRLPTPHTALIDHTDLNLRIHLTASDDFTHAVIYTPEQKPFFCLENQTCSTDAINLARHGRQDVAHLLELSPGEKASGSLSYTVEFH